jgi:hypothetical protein
MRWVSKQKPMNIFKHEVWRQKGSTHYLKMEWRPWWQWPFVPLLLAWRFLDWLFPDLDSGGIDR